MFFYIEYLAGAICWLSGKKQQQVQDLRYRHQAAGNQIQPISTGSWRCCSGIPPPFPDPPEGDASEALDGCSPMSHVDFKK